MKYEPTRDFVNTQDYISQRSYFITWPISGVYAYSLFQQIGNTRYLRLMHFLIFKISWNLSILWQRPSTPCQIRLCVLKMMTSKCIALINLRIIFVVSFFFWIYILLLFAFFIEKRHQKDQGKQKQTAYMLKIPIVVFTTMAFILLVFHIFTYSKCFKKCILYEK